MNDNPDFDLMLYGIMLLISGALVRMLAPDFGYAIPTTGVAGGLLVLLWGVLGLWGFRRRIWPIVTLVAINAALLVQTARAWLAVRDGLVAKRPAAMITTVLLVFGIGQLIIFVQTRHREK